MELIHSKYFIISSPRCTLNPPELTGEKIVSKGGTKNVLSDFQLEWPTAGACRKSNG
jgi:hypothetical protein